MRAGLTTRNTRKVNFLLEIRVPDRLRALFPTGTPVPLTVWKGVAYSRQSNKNCGRGVNSLSAATISVSDELRCGFPDRDIETRSVFCPGDVCLFTPVQRKVPVAASVRLI
jgi:hypothetical protein